MAIGTNCPKCGYPLSYREIRSSGKIGCGCLLVVFSVLLGIWFPIGTILSLVPFGIGLYLLWSTRSRTVPYCSHCGWQGS
jgi:hypothetical protein